MMVLCSANAIIKHDREKSGLPSAPLDMEYDNNITEEYNAIAIALNPKHTIYNPSIDYT
mgnify:CR=1 FL=1